MNGTAARTTKEVLFPIVLLVATLYLGREFFMPLALAILISFLLAPIVRWFEHWHFGRVASVITVTILAFAILGGVGATVGGQLIDLANKLPGYRENLDAKILALKAPKGGAISNATKTLQDLSKELSAEPAAEPVKATDKAPARAELAPSSDPKPSAGLTAKPLPKDAAPIPVSIVTSRNAFETLADFGGPILGPLGTATIVIVFVIFMLLGREDLRDRLIHLIGRGHLQTTTQALDEAGHRVSRYLLAQLLVNSAYGIPIAVGLAFIGIPNAVLWGLLATLLRFIPYIGAWIASAFPIALSLAVAPGWTMPALTVGLFVVVELITNNVLEPWLYGASTGMSALAVIVAAAFWTWLWGMPGLLLATPLTVCIAVLGKYLPSLAFLDVLLGDKPPIAAEDRFYQRLLAKDEDEVGEIAEKYLESHTLSQVYDELIIPAIRLADEDFHRENLSDPRRLELLEQVNLIVSDLGEPKLPKSSSQSAPEAAPAPADADLAAIVIPACDYADELAGLMLTKLLASAGAASKLIPSKLLASEMMEEISRLPVRQFCISVTPPGASRHALYMTKRLRERFPECRILIGVWGEIETETNRLDRYRRSGVDGVFTSLQDMTRQLLATATVVAPTPAAEIPPTKAEVKAEARAEIAAVKAEKAAIKAEAAAADR